jgi:hypothetical protein
LLQDIPERRFLHELFVDPFELLFSFHPGLETDEAVTALLQRHLFVKLRIGEQPHGEPFLFPIIHLMEEEPFGQFDIMQGFPHTMKMF